MRTRFIVKFGLLLFLFFSFSMREADAQKRSSTPSVSGDPGGHTNAGVEYARKKQYDKAIEEFTKAIDAQPNDPKNYRNRAQVYRLARQPDKAIADYGKLIELKPD
jgi:tetratricopeptide (TPR) repeat protein